MDKGNQPRRRLGGLVGLLTKILGGDRKSDYRTKLLVREDEPPGGRLGRQKWRHMLSMHQRYKRHRHNHG